MDIRPGGEFLSDLNSALRNLYDPVTLRRSPLVAFADRTDGQDTPSALRETLVGAIEELKPDVDTPPSARAWRIYEILVYSFVQQLTPQDVADQLGLSVRHLGRERKRALRALADHLWEQYSPHQVGRGESVEDGTDEDDAPATLDQELGWLIDSVGPKSSDLREELQEVLALARPLTEECEARPEVCISPALPQLAVHPTALRQVLLGLLSSALRRAVQGRIQVLAEPVRWSVRVQVLAKSSGLAHPQAPTDTANLTVTAELVELCGGTLDVEADATTFAATLILPSRQQLLVLAVDDNVDTLQLLQRYTMNTRYRLISIRNASELIAVAEQEQPEIVVMDIMMPGLDGWQVLQTLRKGAAFRDTPIIVCTVLAQEDLARSLGASGYVRKPISREHFLAELDRQASTLQ